MTDEMDFSWLEPEWKKARAVQAGQEMFADYTRYMRDLGATEVSKIIDSLDPTVVESDPVEAESIFALAPSSSFTTVPARYKTPADACFVKIEILARRGEVDADDLH